MSLIERLEALRMKHLLVLNKAEDEVLVDAVLALRHPVGAGFAERCRIAQECLPDAEYRQRLTALHDEMLSASAVRSGFMFGWKAAAVWAGRDDLIADIGSPAYEKDCDAACGMGEVPRG